MPIKLKVDEDLGKAVTQLLQARGVSAEGVYEEGMSGWKDPDLWQVGQREERFLITADKGYADLRKYPAGTHHGVMLLRPDQEGIRPMVELLEKVLNQYDISVLSGTVTVVIARNIRIRRK